jgi:hypothetical protein
MRAEKKSRWRADVATPLAPPHLVGGSFPFPLSSLDQQLSSLRMTTFAQSLNRHVPYLSSGRAW